MAEMTDYVRRWLKEHYGMDDQTIDERRTVDHLNTLLSAIAPLMEADKPTPSHVRIAREHGRDAFRTLRKAVAEAQERWKQERQK